MVEEEESLAKEVGDLEQYWRRNCLVLHSIEEKKDECTNQIAIQTFSEELNVDVTVDDPDRSHTLGKTRREDKKQRLIIIKFARYAVWRKVFSSKKKHIGKNLLIKESLTVFKMKLFDEARTKYGVRKVWTFDGRVMCKENNKAFVYKI